MHTLDTLVPWAQQLATEYLAPLPIRLHHVQGVVQHAEDIRSCFDAIDGSYLVAAAYLHDIGYAPALVISGFHPLDGAFHLRDQGEPRLAALVAYHSGAHFEAHLRGFTKALAEFPQEHSAVADALTMCDMLTGPTGKRVSFQERIDEIVSRYGEENLVTRSIRRAMPLLEKAIQRTEELCPEQSERQDSW